MANLIPPDAKKEMRSEYWSRVIVVWFVLISCGLLVTTILTFPSYILIKKQLYIFSTAYNNAQSKQKTFKTAEETIIEANELVELLAAQKTERNLTVVIDALDKIAANNVTILNFRFQKEEGKFSSIKIRGRASTRIAFAQFSKGVEDSSLFVKAEFPISSLAKDKDIDFDIEITPAQE